jgi:tetrapyrrole methylase family protein/MazG family protein
MSGKINALAELVQTVHRLRAPGGCPWDRKQTFQSLRQYFVEETYEVIDVLDQIASPEDLKNEKIKAAFREELGDVLMQVVLHSEMTNETGAFDFYDVAAALNEKLIRRHPHVFGDAAKTDNADAALQNWNQQKAQEKAKEKADNPNASVLDGLPKGLPSLQKTGKIIEKVSKVGFQWDDLQGPLEKLDEELAEFKEEIKAGAPQEKIQAELGDLLFSICNIAHFLKLNPEDGLRATLSKFEARFRHVEASLKKLGKTPEQSNLQEMDRFWEEAKKLGL